MASRSGERAEAFAREHGIERLQVQFVERPDRAGEGEEDGAPDDADA